MRSVATGVILFFQIVLVAVALWQVMGLLPVFSWIGATGVTTGMWLAAGIKAIILVVALLLWWPLGRLRARIRDGAARAT